MSLRRVSRRLAVFAAAAAMAGTLSMLAFAAPASALPQAPGSILCTTTCSSGPFASGQQVEVKLPPSSFASTEVGKHVNIEECAAPGGVPPTDPAACDGLSIQGDTVLINSDGSVDYSNYNIYALPDADIGDTGTTPKCDLSNPCVLYVGENQNDFTQPGFFTESFTVNPDPGANPGDGTPETPLVIGLPLAAAALVGGVWTVRRRRRTAGAPSA